MERLHGVSKIIISEKNKILVKESPVAVVEIISFKILINVIENVSVYLLL